GDMYIVFYNEDSIIYLSRPSSSLSMNNPFAVLDSLINNPNINFSLKQTKQEMVITIETADTSKFKKIIYEISKTTGLLSKMTQIINDELMYDLPVSGPKADKPGYAIITTYFTNYTTATFDTLIFEPATYVKNVGGKYVSLHPYESYQVFNSIITQ
ncbi:MAG: hypothetical protein J7497_07165, partial [Chitinophagaceae bacterium]|nr:hypothetical protein [Chitinophagaceae bacterium]